MSDDPQSSLADIKRFLDSGSSVPLDRVRIWMSSEDEEVLGAVYAALAQHCDRIEPTPQQTLLVDVLLRIMRIGIVRRGAREFSLSPYDAARCLLDLALAWNAVQQDDDGAAAGKLRLLREQVATEYQAGDDKVRRRIVDGFLEHAFETPSLRRIFEGWKNSPILGRAYSEAALWADNPET